ncbi:MAG: hypothetical protein J6V55_01355 [Alistipes sp.]|nr:hypothetical protein [Alistipes sp.]
MERKYKNFFSKISKIKSNIFDEIIEIVKENVKENSEERICIGYDVEGRGIMMKDEEDPIIYHITSIGCKVEDDDVRITLYCNEDYPSAIDWDFEDCGDIDAMLRIYDAVYYHFDELDEDEDEDDNKED